jgi:glycosyltransferase involved in cell wall biosynthesis
MTSRNDPSARSHERGYHSAWAAAPASRVEPRLPIGLHSPMNWPSDCCVVIPCLNEAAAIRDLVSRVKPMLPHVLVVDDGSSDDTANLARSAGAQVLRHDQPQGKGAALLRGWTAAHEQGFSWAIAMDGDGQHDPADLPRFLECADQTGARLVVGNRMANPSGMPWLRRQVNRWMSRQLSRLAHCHLPDTQNGFRLMHLNAWASLTIAAGHFEIESEILWRFAQAGHSIRFVPVQVIYRREHSKINPLRDTLRWFRWFRAARNEARRHSRDG